MPKIVLIGAGSTSFAKRLVVDLLSVPELADAIISLHDIDAERLNVSEIVTQHIVQQLGIHPTVEATTDRHTALKGANYVICMIQVGGYKPCTVIDFDIPKKYGLRQTIGDTIGIGGIMRGLRTIPVLLDICRDMEALCPEALLLNYVNPLAINTWAIRRASGIRVVGLCHGVTVTVKELAKDLKIPAEEISYLCAGINHLAFFLTLERQTADGVEDLYPRLHKITQKGKVPKWNRVRYDLLDRLGYFLAESSEHIAEYVPWFIKWARPDLIAQYNIPLDEYLARCEYQSVIWDVVREKLEHPEISLDDAIRDLTGKSRGAATKATLPGANDYFREMFDTRPSDEYAARIIRSMETGTPCDIYGDVPNDGLIDNLPSECIVEVPCSVDKNGIQPTRIGKLPPHLAALIQTNINVQALTVEAALTGKREHIYHAAMLDPHTAAELDLDQIWHLVDDLIEAHGGWLPKYQ